MLGSQSMTHVLCQAVSYPPLDEVDEYKKREDSSPTKEVHNIEDIMDDVSSCDKDIDQMEGVPIDQYMEQTNKDHG